jgi:hypothetical protein
MNPNLLDQTGKTLKLSMMNSNLVLKKLKEMTVGKDIGALTICGHIMDKPNLELGVGSMLFAQPKLLLCLTKEKSNGSVMTIKLKLPRVWKHHSG